LFLRCYSPPPSPPAELRDNNSSANLVSGILEQNDELVIESMMSEGGVIFSDGVESDFLQFNAGVIARVRSAQQKARLVIAS